MAREDHPPKDQPRSLGDSNQVVGQQPKDNALRSTGDATKIIPKSSDHDEPKK